MNETLFWVVDSSQRNYSRGDRKLFKGKEFIVTHIYFQEQLFPETKGWVTYFYAILTNPDNAQEAR